MDKQRPKPFPGQILYSLNVGNAARGQPQVLTPVTVASVGRKYFTAQRTPGESMRGCRQYHLEDWREKTEYCVDSRLYASPQDWADEQEFEKIHARLRDQFGGYRWAQPTLSLAQLRAIAAIIDGGEPWTQDRLRLLVDHVYQYTKEDDDVCLSTPTRDRLIATAPLKDENHRGR